MTARVDVSVRNADNRFETPFGIAEGAYTASLALLETGEHHTEAALDVKIYEKEVLLDAGDRRLEERRRIDRENGKREDHGGGGGGGIRGRSYENNECRILVSCIAADRNGERLEMETLGESAVTPKTEVGGSIEDMLYDGEDILLSADGNTIVYDKTKLPSAGADMGEATVVIGTERRNTSLSPTYTAASSARRRIWTPWRRTEPPR